MQKRLFVFLLIAAAIAILATSKPPTSQPSDPKQPHLTDEQVQQAWDAEWHAFSTGFKRGWVEGSH